MKLNYFSVAECNGLRIRIRSHLIGKILLNIVLKCASALFYASRWLYLLTKDLKDSISKFRQPHKLADKLSC